MTFNIFDLLRIGFAINKPACQNREDILQLMRNNRAETIHNGVLKSEFDRMLGTLHRRRFYYRLRRHAAMVPSLAHAAGILALCFSVLHHFNVI